MLGLVSLKTLYSVLSVRGLVHADIGVVRKRYKSIEERVLVLEKMRRERESEGFSLIELIIAVAIVAILAAVAIPIFLNRRTKATQAVIQGDMKSIQTEVNQPPPKGEGLNPGLKPG